MRIRKRQLPFSLSPVTFSDPNLINRSPEAVQLNDPIITSAKHSCSQALATLSDDPQPSVQALPPIGKPVNDCDDSLTEERQHKKRPFLVEDGRGQVKEEGQKSNDTRKGSISSAPISTELLASSSPSCSCSSYKQDWRWTDGDKAFPLKKRRGSFATNRNSNNDNSNNNNNNTKKKMTMKMKMKNKTKKKCYDSNEQDDDGEEVMVIRETKQKKVRGGAIMEGSWCSHVFTEEDGDVVNQH